MGVFYQEDSQQIGEGHFFRFAEEKVCVLFCSSVLGFSDVLRCLAASKLGAVHSCHFSTHPHLLFTVAKKGNKLRSKPTKSNENVLHIKNGILFWCTKNKIVEFEDMDGARNNHSE